MRTWLLQNWSNKSWFFIDPFYVWFSILELSYVLMYDFYYNYIKKKYGACAYFCFTDTDSYVTTNLPKMGMSKCWRISSSLTLVITQIHIFSIAMKTRKCWRKWTTNVTVISRWNVSVWNLKCISLHSKKGHLRGQSNLLPGRKEKS